MITLIELNITKSKRGWSVENITHYEGWPNPAYTYSGERTLAIALWSNVPCDDGKPTIKVTVKGVPMSNQRVYEIIAKDLTHSSLSYRLPAYREVLGVTL